MTQEQNTPRPNIRLLADRVLVEVQPAKEVKTASGIILPETSKGDAVSKTEQGLVLRVSERIKNLDPAKSKEDEWDKIEEGELVLFSSFAGSKMFYKGKEYSILRITDIYGAVEPEINSED